MNFSFLFHHHICGRHLITWTKHREKTVTKRRTKIRARRATVAAAKWSNKKKTPDWRERKLNWSKWSELSIMRVINWIGWFHHFRLPPPPPPLLVAFIHLAYFFPFVCFYYLECVIFICGNKSFRKRTFRYLWRFLFSPSACILSRHCSLPKLTAFSKLAANIYARTTQTQWRRYINDRFVIHFV